jgi:hypothetical protein
MRPVYRSANNKKLFTYFFGLFFFTFLSCEQEPIVVKDIHSESAAVEGSEKNGTHAKIGNHSYWYFFRGQSSTNLRYAFSDDGQTWGGNSIFSNGAKSNTGPTVVFYKNRFIAVYTGASSNAIYTSYSTNGTTWTGQKTIPGETAGSPGMTIWHGYLYLFFSGVDSKEIWFSRTFDGLSWSTPTKINNTRLGHAENSIAAVTDPATNHLYLFFHSCCSNGNVNFGTGTPVKWNKATAPLSNGNFTFVYGNDQYVEVSNDCQLSEKIDTRCGTSAAFHNGELYLAVSKWTPPASENIVPTLTLFKMTPQTCFGWTRMSFPAVSLYSGSRPGLCSFNGQMVLVWRYAAVQGGTVYGTEEIRQMHSIDGSNWQGYSDAIGQTANGGPSIIGG